MKRWPLTRVPFWQEAPFFRLLPPLVAGIICYDRLAPVVSLSWLPAACTLITGLFFFLALRRRQPTGRRLLLFGLVQAGLFLLALWSCSRQDVRREPHWLGNSRDSLNAYLSEVLEAPAERERVWKLHVRLTGSLQEGRHGKPVAGEAFLYVYKGGPVPDVHPGDTLLLPGGWQPLTNMGNPHEFDYRTLCRRRNITHQQLIRSQELVVYARAAPQAVSWTDRLHRLCDRQLQRYFRDSLTLGLLQAMLLGDETSFDPALRQVYADTGVVHIVSISGSHVAVLFLVVTGLLFWIRGRYGAWLRYGIGLVLVWIYVVMAGAPPSAVRSALMFSALALGMMVSRETQPLNTLLAAAFILLIARPMWLFAIGFQLSFAAVLSLILFYRPLYRLWPQTSRPGRWLWGATAGSCAAEVLTAPLVVYYFHNFPLFFLPANLLAAALVGTGALLGGMAVAATSCMPPVAGALATGVTAIVRLFNGAIRVLQGWNPEALQYLRLDGKELLLIYAVTAGFALFLLKRQKLGLFAGLGAACALVLCLCLDRAAVLEQQRLVVYNISRHTWVEQVGGRGYRVLYADTAVADHYIARQARIAWGAWRRAPEGRAGSCFLLAGKRVLLLDDAPASGTFPVDILIVQRPLKELSPSRLQRVFHPGLIVAGSSQSRWQVQKWKDSCRRLGQAFHATAVDGAFVLE